MGPELLLDYPNDESLKKFQERKEKGMIPVPPGSEAALQYMPHVRRKNGPLIIFIIGPTAAFPLNTPKCRTSIATSP